MGSCVKNVCTKIIKIYQSFFKSQMIMLWMLFDVFLFILTHISLVHFPQVVQKQTLNEVVNWLVIWWPVVPEIFVPRIIKIGRHFFEWQSIMLGMFFSTHGVYTYAYLSFASNLEQVANLMCAQVDFAFYPQWNEKWVAVCRLWGGLFGPFKIWKRLPLCVSNVR